MRSKDMVALGRVVLSKRERVIMLQPWDSGLLGMTLRYPYELREAKDYFYDIPDMKVEPELLALAQQILRTKEAKFDPTRFVDRYEQAVVEMLQQKQAGLPATVKTFPPPRAVPDLMEAFRKSLAAVQAETARKSRRRSLKSRASGKCCCTSRAGKPRPKHSPRRLRGEGRLMIKAARARRLVGPDAKASLLHTVCVLRAFDTCDPNGSASRGRRSVEAKAAARRLRRSFLFAALRTAHKLYCAFLGSSLPGSRRRARSQAPSTSPGTQCS